MQQGEFRGRVIGRIQSRTQDWVRVLARSLEDVRWIALASVATVSLLYQLPVLPGLGWFLIPLCLCLKRFPGRVWVAAVCMAAAWSVVQAQQQLAHRLPVNADGERVWVTGRVAGLPESGPYRTRFEFESTRPSRHLRLSWYRDAPALAAGDCLTLKVKLSTPHGSANPGGFDYSAWLWRQGVDATGYVRATKPCNQPPQWRLDRLRAAALARLSPVLEASPVRGLLEALSLGVRTHITDDQWATLRATGTTHLVAISGLHIGLVAGWLFVLARWLALRSPVFRSARRLAAAVAIVGALAYAGLAGWALPTQRAVIMVVAAMLALVFERRISAGQALAWAALAVLGWHPAAVIAPGFWLSFGAVAWLIGIAALVRGPWWRKALACHLGLVIALLPLTLWFFGQASLVAPWVNALLIPLAGIVVPIVLLAVCAALIAPVAGGWALGQVAAALAAVWPGLAELAQWPVISFGHVLTGPVMLLLALAGMIVLAAPVPWRLRGLGVIFLLPAMIGWSPGRQPIRPGDFRVTVLDVGQGLASVVRTARHTLVFDAGPAYRTGFDAGAMIVVPYLRQVGRGVVDRLMISHGDMDHIGGARAIMAALPVRHRSGAGSRDPCRAGEHWHWDGVDFDVLYPDAAEAASADNSNERSCVLRIHSGRASALFTGDIEAPGEHALVQRSGAGVASDILVVPHHGSASSSSPALIDIVAPRAALISSGWHNRWGFPRPVVTARYHTRGIALFDTADSGALTVFWPQPHRPLVVRWRRQHARFWQQPLPGG